MSGRNDLSTPQPGKPPAKILALAGPDPTLVLLQVTLALLLFVLLQVVLVRAASAHALLVDSQPADGAVLDEAPDRVRATFSEELDSGLSSMRVFDNQGAQVDNGDGGVDLDDLDHLSMVVTLPPLPPGAYTVRWTAASADDGDDTEGAFSFTIGGGAGAAQASAARASVVNTNLVLGLVAAGLILLVALIAALVRRRQAASPES